VAVLDPRPVIGGAPGHNIPICKLDVNKRAIRQVWLFAAVGNPHVFVCKTIIPIQPNLLHAFLALFPYIRRGWVCSVEFFDDGASAVSCRSLASQREVRRAVFVAVRPVFALLAAHRLQQRHEQPALLLSQMVSGNGLERLHGRAHAALAFWLVVGGGPVLHVAGCGFKYVVCGGHAMLSPTNRPNSGALYPGPFLILPFSSNTGLPSTNLLQLERLTSASAP